MAGVHESHFARHLSGDATYLVAWLGDEPAGSAMVLWTGPVGVNAAQVYPDVFEVAHMQVRSRYQGQGVGRVLMSAAQQVVMDAGARQVSVSVSDDNAGARRLYARLGYTPTGIKDVVEYDWVSDTGMTHHEIEHSELLVKICSVDTSVPR
ncbi:MAG: GNAT family N-acetyltransferase [Ornithinimicrobium sp.]